MARIYDYLLGGKNNFAADRQAAAQITRALPDVAQVALANRRFLAAAVRYVAGQGIGQYVDIGAGLPTSPNVHESARAAVPDARVVYIDNDPFVVAHAGTQMAADDRVRAISGDARDIEGILSAPGLGALIDLREPVCVLFVSMLHFLAAGEADAAVAAFRERMAPGSYLVISAGHQNGGGDSVQEQLQASYGDTTVLTGRSAAEIAAYFGDFELVPPGIVPVTQWAPGALRPRPQMPPPAHVSVLAGVGRKRR